VGTGPGEAGDGIGGGAGREEGAQFVGVRAEREDGDEILEGPEGDAVVDGFVESFFVAGVGGGRA
jgi:hypothetical protein